MALMLQKFNIKRVDRKRFFINIAFLSKSNTLSSYSGHVVAWELLYEFYFKILVIFNLLRK